MLVGIEKEAVMVVLVRSETDMLAPDDGDDSRPVDRPWLVPRAAEREQGLESPPPGVAPWGGEADERLPVDDTDGSLAFAAAMASWRQASLLFTRSVRTFNAAHRRHRQLRSQAASLEMSPRHREVADVAAPTPAGQPTPACPAQMPGPSPLTRRQREVAVLIARGCSDKQIADELVLTQGTASNHVAHILRRLGCRSRAQVAAWAVQNDLLPLTGS